MGIFRIRLLALCASVKFIINGASALEVRPLFGSLEKVEGQIGYTSE